MTNVGDGLHAENAAWSFAGEVSVGFDAHVSKSIPLYQQGHELVLSLSDFFVTEDSMCYDIGCATGVLLEKLLLRHQVKPNVNFVGIDLEPDMITQAKARCQSYSQVEIHCGNLMDFQFEATDFIVAYYTLQFIRPKFRQELLERLYSALNWGGSLLLFEKVRAPDARFQDLATALYADYKLAQGYSGEQILAKALSLKGILEPFSNEGNLGLLRRSGFVDITTVMKYICFEGFLAIK